MVHEPMALHGMGELLPKISDWFFSGTKKMKAAQVYLSGKFSGLLLMIMNLDEITII